MKTLLMMILLAAPCFGQAREAIVSKDGEANAALFDDAIQVNVRSECQAELVPIIAAIRYAENGRAGREYGILHERCPDTYRGQAGWCAATVQKNYDRWVKAGSEGEFISFLGARYCPLDDPRDKDGLNRHWIKNVSHFTKKFSKKG